MTERCWERSEEGLLRSDLGLVMMSSPRLTCIRMLQPGRGKGPELGREAGAAEAAGLRTELVMDSRQEKPTRRAITAPRSPSQIAVQDAPQLCQGEDRRDEHRRVPATQLFPVTILTREPSMSITEKEEQQRRRLQQPQQPQPSPGLDRPL